MCVTHQVPYFLFNLVKIHFVWLFESSEYFSAQIWGCEKRKIWKIPHDIQKKINDTRIYNTIGDKCRWKNMISGRQKCPFLITEMKLIDLAICWWIIILINCELEKHGNSDAWNNAQFVYVYDTAYMKSSAPKWNLTRSRSIYQIKPAKSNKANGKARYCHYCIIVHCFQHCTCQCWSNTNIWGHSTGISGK